MAEYYSPCIRTILSGRRKRRKSWSVPALRMFLQPVKPHLKKPTRRLFAKWPKATVRAFYVPKGCTVIQPRTRAMIRRTKLTDNAEKNQGQNPGQSGQQSGQQQQKNPQDISKKDSSQDSNKEHGNQPGKQDQGGQRRVS